MMINDFAGDLSIHTKGAVRHIVGDDGLGCADIIHIDTNSDFVLLVLDPHI